MSEEIKKAQDRLDILKKQEEYELEGKFDLDLEADPPRTRNIKPGEVDFKRKRLINKIRAKIAFSMGHKLVKKLKKAGLFELEKIIGLDNLKSIKTGAVITCNHFNPFDSFAVQLAFEAAKFRKKKFFRIIKEGNYTDFPGLYGFMMKYCNTLPLCENKNVMMECFKATKELLQEGHIVLVYPEQAMWWNYRKPRPLKTGAFRFAAIANVPVVPMYIEQQDTDRIGPDGFPIQKYTIHIGSPIYPDDSKNMKDNTIYMAEQNENVWKNIYEKAYNTKLVYNTKEK